jgi:hypothetical protein
MTCCMIMTEFRAFLDTQGGRFVVSEGDELPFTAHVWADEIYMDAPTVSARLPLNYCPGCGERLWTNVPG